MKSFWERPEGNTGMIVLALGATGLWFAKDALLSGVTTLRSLVNETIFLTISGVALFLLLNIIFNPRVQNLVTYGFKSIMRLITQAFVEIDPIGIMRSYVDRMKDKREVMSTLRDKLKGQLRIIDQKIKDNSTGYDNAMKMVKVAKEQGKTAALTVQSRQAGRLEKLNAETYLPLKAQMEAHLRAANKYHEVTGIVIEDLENEVTAQSDRRKMMTASYGVMKAAKSIMSSGGTERELFDQAMEYVVEDYGMKLGEIEQFIENSQPFVDGLDMQNGMYEASALERLQAWEAKADGILLSPKDKQQLQLENAPTAAAFNFAIGSPAAVDYDALIRKQ
jgi:hypothetical protein